MPSSPADHCSPGVRCSATIRRTSRPPATYAEASRMNAEREGAQAERARMPSALEAIAEHAQAIATRSRVYRLARLFGGLRRRIEMIAAEAARALGGR